MGCERSILCKGRHAGKELDVIKQKKIKNEVRDIWEQGGDSRIEWTQNSLLESGTCAGEKYTGMDISKWETLTYLCFGKIMLAAC